MYPIAGSDVSSPRFATLVDAFERLADTHRPLIHAHRGASVSSLTGAQWVELAARWSAALRDAGVRPGDRVLLLLPNDLPFVAAFFGILRLGAVAVPLAWPAGANAAAALGALTPLVQKADAKALVAPEGLSVPWAVPVVTTPADRPRIEVADLHSAATAFLQFTSGSLGRPRGAVISHRAAVHSAWAMGRAMGVGPDDVGVSWLPLFHDMGLVGALFVPLIYGFPLHLMSPGEFLLHPRRWLERVHAARGTVAAAPDFAWELARRRVQPDGLDLSCWRWALSGSEPVHRATLDGFHERFGGAGFPGIHPVYGLAEYTLGVAFATDAAPDVTVDGRPVPSVGRPLPGAEVAISGEGEILVRGPCLMDGYFRDDEASAAALRGGWLHTGDLGRIEDGRLYVTGREKDVLIQAGRKFHPYDLENRVSRIVNGPPNGVAAVSVPDGDRDVVVIVAELAGPPGADLERSIRGELADEVGIRVERVVWVQPGAVPRTTSGKIRRAALVERLARGVAP